MTEQSPVATEANIAPALADLVVPIDVPELHPTNPRKGNVEVIAESLQRYGQIRPIIVQRSTAYVIAGNHTLKAARALGWQQIAAVVIDIDDDEAQAYIISDNSIADLGTYDNEVMAPILEKLMLSGKLGGTGWTPDAVDDLMSTMDALPEVEPAEFKGEHGISDEELAEKFKNRSQGGALRQFVFLYEQAVGVEVEGMLTRLARAWGVSGARDVMLEALRRASADPPVEGLSAAEKALADAPPAEEDPVVPRADVADIAPDPTAASADEPAPPASPPAAPSETEQTPLERAGLVDPPGPETPPQPVTRREAEEQMIEPQTKYPD